MPQKQPTKAQKRRAHQEEKEDDREAELEAERAQQGESEKDIEAKQLQEMLSPLGLSIREIQVHYGCDCPYSPCLHHSLQAWQGCLCCLTVLLLLKRQLYNMTCSSFPKEPWRICLEEVVHM